MPEALLGDLWMHASEEELSGMAVPQVVKADPRHFHSSGQSCELVRQAPVLQRLSIPAGAYERVARLPPLPA